MALTTPGLHHVTAIAGDPTRNAEFYVETLGLRLVKRTVNHDDTGTYHLYFGDGEGRPGTNITVFPWTDEGRAGEFGAGQTRATAYLIDPDSVDYWEERLTGAGIDVERTQRFGDPVLAFVDPDGIGLELIGADAPSAATPWSESPVPDRHQLRGFHAVTLAVADPEPTASLLTDVLGYELAGTEDGRRRYRSAAGGPGSIVDIFETGTDRGRMGVGTVHHVAFVVDSVEEEQEWLDAFEERGLEHSGIIDRKYFTSIYVREPGGVLFEFATPSPGFTADEDLDDLGSRLTLPEWLEADRESIEAQLPAFEPPEPEAADE